jgi:hypothetical protein
MDIISEKDHKGLLTAGQTAALCSVTRNAVCKWIQSGYLSCGSILTERRDIDPLPAVPFPAVDFQSFSLS